MAPRFDWIRFLNQHNIDYATSGANVSRGHIAVHCPFCGERDKSQHLSVNTRGPGWRCWRDPDNHRGRSYQYLVQALLRCSPEEAKQIVGEDLPGLPDTDDELAEKRARLFPQLTGEALELPREFSSLLSGSPMATPFLRYMRDRGFRDSDISWLTETYDLRYAIRGPFAWRLIVPVYGRDGSVLTWTGRALGSDVEPRYRTLYDAGEKGGRSTSQTILGLHRLSRVRSGRALIICEGPFDALRMSASGYSLGVWATCLFGLQLYAPQRQELMDLADRFSGLYLMIDAEARVHRLRLMESMYPLRVGCLDVPDGYEDPGALPPEEALRVCMEVS